MLHPCIFALTAPRFAVPFQCGLRRTPASNPHLYTCICVGDAGLIATAHDGRLSRPTCSLVMTCDETAALVAAVYLCPAKVLPRGI